MILRKINDDVHDSDDDQQSASMAPVDPRMHAHMTTSNTIDQLTWRQEAQMSQRGRARSMSVEILQSHSRSLKFIPNYTDE